MPRGPNKKTEKQEDSNVDNSADFEFIYLDYEISCVPAKPDDPGQFSQPIDAKILVLGGPGSADDSLTEIGELAAMIIRISQAQEAQWDVSTTLDAYSGECADCTKLFDDNDYTEAVQKLFDYDVCVDDILLVTRIEIKPEYRGHNVGLVAMRALIDMFGKGCGLVVCQPFPLQYGGNTPVAHDDKEYQKALEKLRKYWSRVGFKRVPKTDLYALAPHFRLPALPETETV
jgi:GNAT superfamily N-acetyltransferase